MPTRVTFRGHVLNTACLQTVWRSVTSIKARWLEHRNTFALGSSLSFEHTSTAIRELSRTDGIKVSRKTVRKYYKCFRQNSPIGDLPRSGRQTKGDTHTNAQTGPKNIWEIHLATAS